MVKDIFGNTIKPNEIIFIDDTFNYKRATESVGINFRNPQQLKIELKRYEVFLSQNLNKQTTYKKSCERG